MKKKHIILSTSLLVASFISVTFISSLKNYEKADAYSTSSLPTTIDLNDTSSSDIRKYYSSLNSLSESERKGNNLLKNLKTILKNGQKYYSYDSGAAIWQIYEISDRDWELSPASGTTYGTYNALTNKITGYQYGTKAANSKNNPYIHALYVNRDVLNQTTAWDDHQQTQWGINREHIWPKSQGFEAEGEGGARGDPMHLWAGNGRVNGTEHNNYYYGFVDTSKSYKDPYNEKGWENLKNNYLGTSLTLGSGSVFEPQDSDKGDIARAIFYMVARYNYLSGSDSDGIDTNNPNLELVQSASKESSFTSTTSRTGKMGILSDLLEWNRLDPPDAWEIHRNNLLYTNYTNNRNPFIDFPEWAEYIWGKAIYSDREYVSHNTTPTGYAAPSTDLLNDFNGVSSGSVTISDSSLSLEVGDTSTISATSSDSSTISWSSSNTSVATVSSASSASSAEVTITAVANGNATITASATIGGKEYTDTCLVSVSTSAAASGDAELYTGALTEGDYVIVYNNRAMKSVVSSSRMGYSTITITNNKISSPSDDIIWHIAPSDDDWTIYNAKVDKYASSTGASNKIKLSTVPDEYSLWTPSGTSPYEFSNNYNKNDDKNHLLRNNGTYGFACYAAGTGGALSLYKVTDLAPTSISATATRSFTVGDTITKSDIVVTDNFDNVIDDYTFTNNGYQFTYSDAPSGGSAGEKEFSITYDELETILTVDVCREEYEKPETESLAIGKTDIGLSSISTSSSSRSTGDFLIGDVMFYVSNAYIFKSEISFGKNEGFVRNSNAFERDIESFEFAVYETSRTDGVKYISRTGSDDDWVAYSEIECAKGGYRYFKIAYESYNPNKYANITDIDIVLVGEENAINLSNYIMFEDTNNQCLTKLDVAIIHFNNMSTSGRSTFMSSNEYVIRTARERLNAWLINQDKEITYVNGDYVVSSASPLNQLTNIIYNDYTSIVVIVTILSMISIVSFIYFVKKKERIHI